MDHDHEQSDPTESIIDEVEESDHLDFPCGTCGAQLTWDPDADALTCEHCGGRVVVPRAEGTILERPLSEASDAVRGFGIENRVLRCDTCGAQVTLGESSTADACVYCGSAQVLAQEANRNAIRPESLVPLDIGRDVVEVRLRRWVRSLWFRPNELKKMKRFNAIGVYVPFWTFDCQVYSEWSADAGYYYYVTERYTTTVNGKRVQRTRRKRKIRWVPAWGDRNDAFDDILLSASRGVAPDLISALGDFELRALVPYKPEYLAGWRAEEYQVDLDTAWTAGQAIVRSAQERRCAGDVPGDTHRSLRVQNTISDVRWKHVLLPIWVVHYRFRGTVYPVLVNGQTGWVVGKAPYSWVKITLAVAGALAAAGGVAIAAGAFG